MNLTSLNFNEYIGLLASDAPAPGGGSASALSGAQGAALCAMAAALTVGKKKYAAEWEHCAKVHEAAKALAVALTAQVDADTAAFELVSAAYRLPKDTDEEKAARGEAIAAATVTATEVPLETMRLAAEAIKLTASLIGRSNTNCASDLGCASLNLTAAVRGAWLNVLINLPGIADPAEADSFRVRGRDYLAAAAGYAAAVDKAMETL